MRAEWYSLALHSGGSLCGHTGDLLQVWPSGVRLITSLQTSAWKVIFLKGCGIWGGAVRGVSQPSPHFSILMRVGRSILMADFWPRTWGISLRDLGYSSGGLSLGQGVNAVNVRACSCACACVCAYICMCFLSPLSKAHCRGF